MRPLRRRGQSIRLIAAGREPGTRLGGHPPVRRLLAGFRRMAEGTAPLGARETGRVTNTLVRCRRCSRCLDHGEGTMLRFRGEPHLCPGCTGDLVAERRRPPRRGQDPCGGMPRPSPRPPPRPTGSASPSPSGGSTRPSPTHRHDGGPWAAGTGPALTPRLRSRRIQRRIPLAISGAEGLTDRQLRMRRDSVSPWTYLFYSVTGLGFEPRTNGLTCLIGFRRPPSLSGRGGLKVWTISSPSQARRV